MDWLKRFAPRDPPGPSSASAETEMANAVQSLRSRSTAGLPKVAHLSLTQMRSLLSGSSVPASAPCFATAFAAPTHGVTCRETDQRQLALTMPKGDASGMAELPLRTLHGDLGTAMLLGFVTTDGTHPAEES